MKRHCRDQALRICTFLQCALLVACATQPVFAQGVLLVNADNGTLTIMPDESVIDQVG